MKTMKKGVLILCCIVLAASLCVTLVSCVTYNTKPGKMSELVGTYKLSTYDVTPDAEPGDESTFIERTQDYLKLKGVEAYLVVTGTDRGYYFYKDNENDWTGEIVSLEYEYSKDNNNNITDRIQTVKWDKGVGSNGTGFPGAVSERLGFNKSTKKLNETHHSFNGKWIKIKNTTKVAYTRVSKDVTANSVLQTIGKSMSFITYEIKQLSGLLEYRLGGSGASFGLDDINPYIYCIVDFNNATLDATVYYALKADYAAGKRDAELNKTANYKVGLEEDRSNVILDFKFADADANPIYKIYRGTAVTSVSGEWFNYTFDSENNKYVVAEEGHSSAVESLVVLPDDGTELNDRIAALVEAYAASLS